MTSETIISVDDVPTPLHMPKATVVARKGRHFAAMFLLSFMILWVTVMVIHFIGNPTACFRRHAT